MRAFLGLIIAALVGLSAWQAEASITTTGAGKVPGGAPPPTYTGPLDVVASAKACYSFRACSAALATALAPAIKISRTSDSIECAVRVTAAGDLNTSLDSSTCTGGTPGSAVLTSFCAATTCHYKWLDQTVSGLDATSSTAAPTVSLSCLSSKPCGAFNGSQVLNVTTASIAQPLTISAVAIRTSGTTQADIVTGGTGVFFDTTGMVAAYFTGFASTTAANSVWHAMQFSVAGSSSAFNIDGTEVTGQAFGSSDLSADFFIGAQDSAGGTSPLTGNMAEVIIWDTSGPGAINSTQRNAVCHNQTAYWGITASC